MLGQVKGKLFDRLFDWHVSSVRAKYGLLKRTHEQFNQLNHSVQVAQQFKLIAHVGEFFQYLELLARSAWLVQFHVHQLPRHGWSVLPQLVILIQIVTRYRIVRQHFVRNHVNLRMIILRVLIHIFDDQPVRFIQHLVNILNNIKYRLTGWIKQAMVEFIRLTSKSGLIKLR